MPNKEPLKVVELFAGIGGFRLGLEGHNGRSASSDYKRKMEKNYEVVWSNQYEPSIKTQHANEIYRYHFERMKSSVHCEEPIESVDHKKIPDHDLLVGGFPCQDFSIGKLNRLSKGLKGKKGVLWYQIKRILDNNVKDGRPTKYILLENVDRLLKCPVDVKGADFTAILNNLKDLDYAVEWKVINAADYNMPQRRKRVFILAYHKCTRIFETILQDSREWLIKKGVLATSFRSSEYLASVKPYFSLDHANAYIGPRLNLGGANHYSIGSNYLENKKIPSLFENSGVMINGKVLTAKHISQKMKNERPISIYLESDESLITNDFIVTKKDYNEKWAYQRGKKNILRTTEDESYSYVWHEGTMSPFDDINLPARTIITNEGGAYALRTKHIIPYKDAYRRLLPSELDQLSMFPKDFTKNGKNIRPISDSRRAFLIGNSLVVGVVEKIGKQLYRHVKNI